MNSDQNPYDSTETSDLRSSQPGGEEFQSYLIHNAVVAGMCCVPLGIWGIITARKAEQQQKAGNPEAHETAKKARSIFIGGMVLGVITVILIVVAQIAVET